MSSPDAFDSTPLPPRKMNSNAGGASSRRELGKNIPVSGPLHNDLIQKLSQLLDEQPAKQVERASEARLMKLLTRQALEMSMQLYLMGQTLRMLSRPAARTGGAAAPRRRHCQSERVTGDELISRLLEELFIELDDLEGKQEGSDG